MNGEFYKIGDAVLVKPHGKRWYIGVIFSFGKNDWLHVLAPHKKNGKQRACHASICQRLDGQFEPQWFRRGPRH